MQAVPTVEEAMRLNPCSTGITFLTIMTVMYIILLVSS